MVSQKEIIVCPPKDYYSLLGFFYVVSYTKRHKSLRIHTQRFSHLTLSVGFLIIDKKGKCAIFYNALYK